MILFISNLSYLDKSGRRGRISWSKVKADPESLIDSRFLSDIILWDPPRMSLQDVSAYWKDWVSKDQEGDPFSFFSLDDNSDRDKGKGANDGDRDNGDGGAQEGAMEQPPSPPDNYLPDDHFSVDDDIPLPLSCKTPSQRTSCLQQLIYDHGEPNKTFHKLVKAVDTLEVSSISSILSLAYLTKF